MAMLDSQRGLKLKKTKRSVHQAHSFTAEQRASHFSPALPGTAMRGEAGCSLERGASTCDFSRI